MTISHVDPDHLRDFTTVVYQDAGLPTEEAQLCADTLVQADLWGHQSHGVMRLRWYRARLRAGVCDAAAKPETILDSGAIAVIDGHEAMGQVVATYAAEEAIGRAKKHGIGAVAVRNSNHFGAALYYTLMAARAGCIGFLCTNASPAMAPWGGSKKIVGNNPWSWACPAGSYDPMVLDIANTAVARGKIYLACQKGLPIPEGWAIDAEGTPTVDPQKAIDGIILPMAGHKGYAISVIMDMLAGVLSGSSFGPDVHGPYQSGNRSGAGHFMIAIDIAALQPIEAFNQRMEEMITGLKDVPLAKGFEEVFYPGEIEAGNDRQNRRDGLLLPADTVESLNELARHDGLKAVLSSE